MPSAFEHPHRIAAILDVLGIQTADTRTRNSIDLAAALLTDNQYALEDFLNGLDVSRSVSPITAGYVVLWAGGAVPAGWLLCNGAAISRSVYSVLFGVVGVVYGVGDGSTTFNLPNQAAVSSGMKYIIKV